MPNFLPSISCSRKKSIILRRKIDCVEERLGRADLPASCVRAGQSQLSVNREVNIPTEWLIHALTDDSLQWLIAICRYALIRSPLWSFLWSRRRRRRRPPLLSETWSASLSATESDMIFFADDESALSYYIHHSFNDTDYSTGLRVRTRCSDDDVCWENGVVCAWCTCTFFNPFSYPVKPN